MFWKRRKKKQEKELSDAEVEHIIRGYSEVLKRAMGGHLPRRMRRAMSKGNKGWSSLSAGQRKAQVQEVRQKGLSPWLEETTQEAYEQVASYATDTVALEQELKEALAQFKKEQDIR